ncbi:MAG: redoxin domain-containing protein [Pirellula sp.]
MVRSARIRKSIDFLEKRYLCAADFQNSLNRLDVNASGVVEPLDALIVINDINQHGIRTLAAKSVDYAGPMIDVNGDGGVSPLDVLIVINSLNRIDVGSVAPAVRLPNQDGEMVDLTSFLGERTVVLYFYPKDETPGCTVEALDFSHRKTQIQSLGAEVFGVSLDSVQSHNEFADGHKLNFDILADTDRQVTTAYGALTEFNNTPIARRTTFIIGMDGIVKKVFTDVDVLIHGEEVVAALQAGVR